MSETFPRWLLRNHADAFAAAGLSSAGMFFLRYGRPLTGEVAFTVLDKAGEKCLEGVCNPRGNLLRLGHAKPWDGVTPARELEENLIPLPAAGVDALETYMPDVCDRPVHVSAARLANVMGIHVRGGLLSAGGETLGRTCFGEGGVEVVLDDDAILRRRAKREEVLLHELAHCLRDLPFLSFSAVSPRDEEEVSRLEEAARRFTLELAMPEKAMLSTDWGCKYPEARVSAAFGVSLDDARARLERLLPPPPAKSFFRLPFGDAARLCATRPVLLALLEMGVYVYLQDLFCLNLPAYVEDGALTPLATRSMEECCLRIQQVRRDRGVGLEKRDVDLDLTEEEEQQLAELYVRFGQAVEEEQQLAELAALPFDRLLVAMMERQHVTTETLAERTGYSETAISHFRRGLGVPKLRGLLALCAGLHLPPRYTKIMMQQAGRSYNPGSKEDTLYRTAMATLYHLRLPEINRILINAGARPLCG